MIQLTDKAAANLLLELEVLLYVLFDVVDELHGEDIESCAIYISSILNMCTGKKNMLLDICVTLYLSKESFGLLLQIRGPRIGVISGSPLL